MNKAIGVVLLCVLPLVGCQSLTRSLGLTGEHLEDLGETMQVHAEAEEVLLSQLQAGEITQAEYIEQAQALRKLATEAKVGEMKLLWGELGALSESVKMELALNADDAAGAFVGGLAQGQGPMNAGIAALMALLGAGGTVFASRSRQKSEQRSAVTAKEIAEAATAKLAAERNASRIDLVSKMQGPA